LYIKCSLKTEFETYYEVGGFVGKEEEEERMFATNTM
jgi:hypothetical protein